METVTVNQDGMRSALDAGAALGSPKSVELGGAAFYAVVPERHRVELFNPDTVERWKDKPFRKRGLFKFSDMDSFTRYFNEHKDDASRIFVDVTETGFTFKGVLNFHGKDPAWLDHVCLYESLSTPEWKVWCENNKKPMGQAGFALFLEENADMFKDPSGAALLDLVTTLEGKADVSINTAVKLQSGAIKVQYDETVELKGGTTTTSGAMEIPKLITVSIAPFEGCGRYDIVARLRYRIERQKLSLWYEAVAPHLVVRTIASDLLKVCEEKTKQALYKV